MSATIVFPIVPQLGASAWTLAGTLRFINDSNGNPVRIELAPQSPFANDPEFDTTQSASGSTMGNWTVANLSNCNSIDGNTTQKSALTIINKTTTATDWFGSTETGGFVYQVLVGDFDVYARVFLASDAQLPAGGVSVALTAQSTTTATSFMAARASFRAFSVFGTNQLFGFMTISTLTGTGSFTAGDISGQFVGGNWIYVRLKRASTVFSCYWSLDGKNWTLISNVTRSDFSSGQNLGITWSTDGNSYADAVQGGCDFLRTWPPYDTTSPTASVVIDSGVSGTTWTMSTFQDFLNEYKEYSPQSGIGFGTLAYQYGAGNSNPPSLNGSWLSTASMQAQSNPSGRYFKLAVQFNSANGYQLADFNGATIAGVVSTGGGGQIINGGCIAA